MTDEIRTGWPTQGVVEHAKIIVNHSCKVKRDDFVLVVSNRKAVDLLVEIASELGRIGANYLVSDSDDSVTRAYFLAADDETIPPSPLNYSI